MQMQNGTGVPVGACSLQFNVNTFGLAAVSPSVTFNAAPGGTGSAEIPCHCVPASVSAGAAPSLNLDMALRDDTSGTVVMMPGYTIPLEALLSEDGAVDRSTFVPMWKSLGAAVEKVFNGVVTADLDGSLAIINKKLQAANVFYAAQRELGDGKRAVYYSAKFMTGAVTVLVELTFKAGFPIAKAAVKCAQAPMCEFTMTMLGRLLAPKA